MDPLNSPPQMQEEPPVNMGGGHQEQKKRLLTQLMQSAMGGPSKGIHDAVHAIKTALGAYKTFAKEWDTVNGKGEQAPQEGQEQGQMAPPMSMPPPMPPMPMQPPMPPVAPQLPPVLPNASNLIAPPMPMFLGGGNPAQVG